MTPTASPFRHWAILLLASIAIGAALEALRIPAALLLGPMIAAIACAATDRSVTIPRAPFLMAQGIVGCLVARVLTPDLATEIAADWPQFVAGVLSVIVASNAIGWFLARRGLLPGSSAIWGSAPGAAMAMTLMAESYGADVRLVAFMQYVRVVLVTLVAALVAHVWAPHGTAAAAPAMTWFPPVDAVALAATLALAAIGAVAGQATRIPAGALLVPMVAGAVLQDTGVLTLSLPPWLLAIAYTVIGWNIGLRFTRPILVHVARIAPRVIASTLLLIVACGGMAALLVVFAGVDPLTAYLATSPGGADSAAIIGASTHADLSYVMAMQTARFVAVVAIGPAIARWIVRHGMPRER